jgi:ATP-dependent Clp protease ATP-binding subunit ClpA
MFFERFSEKARTVVVLAQQQARERGDATIGTEHLLLGLLAVPDNLAVLVLEAFSVRRADVEADLDTRCPPPTGGRPDATALAALGIDLDEVRRRVEEAFGPGALDRVRRPRGRRWGGHIPFTKGSKKILELALREAVGLGHDYIGTEHLLLGVLDEEDGLGARTLTDLGVTREAAGQWLVPELQRMAEAKAAIRDQAAGA